MASIAEPRVMIRDIVLVEDEALEREELSRFLRNKGFKVHPAAEGRSAVRLANSFPESVVLMDLALEEGFDGIDAAAEIQRAQPQVSLIFVTAYSHESKYRDRAERLGIKAAGWIKKPIPQDELVQLIEKEATKVALRFSIAQARERGVAPEEHLRGLGDEDPQISSAIQEVTAELKESSMNTEEMIDSLYDQIRDLVVRAAEKPELRRKIDPLVRRLRTLQEQEAEAMEIRYKKQLLLQPGEGRRALEEGRRLLRK